MQLSSLFFQPRLNQTTVFVPNKWLIGVTHTVNACRSLGSGQNFSYHTYQVVRWSVCFFILYFGPLKSGINRNASFNMRAYSICLFPGRNVQLCDRHVGQTLKCYSCLLSCVFVFICSEPQACGSQGVWKFHEGVWCKNACLCLLTVNGSLKWNLFGCFRLSICPPDCSVYPHSHPSVEIAGTGDSVGKLYDTTPTPQQAHACWGKLSFLNLLFTSRFHASWW